MGDEQRPQQLKPENGPEVGNREALVRHFLRKGVEVTEELIRENHQLQARVDQLDLENGRLRAQIASEDAIRDLIVKIEQLERERMELLTRSNELEHSKRQHQGRYEQVEQELSDLANLYVASFQLHTSLSPKRVVRHILELLEQLVGAKSCVLYMMNPDRKRIHPIASQGLSDKALEVQTVGEGPIGEVCLTGLPYIGGEEGAFGAGTVDAPLAVIPLAIEEETIGAISVVEMLAQKSGWASVDKELFQLLAGQASTALVSATLFHANQQSAAHALAALHDALRTETEGQAGDPTRVDIEPGPTGTGE